MIRQQASTNTTGAVRYPAMPASTAGVPPARSTRRAMRPVEGRPGIRGQPGVDRRWLDHGAAGRRDPVEPLGLVEQRQGAGVGVAGAQPGDEVQVRPDAPRGPRWAPSAAAVARRGGSARRGTAAGDTAARCPRSGARRAPRRGRRAGSRTGTGRAQASARAAARSRPAFRGAGRAPPSTRSASAAARNGRGASQPARQVGHEPLRGTLSQSSGTWSRMPSRTASSSSGARRASASTREPAYGSRTWSAACGNGRRAWASGSRQVCWTYSAAPWSMSHRLVLPGEQVRVAGVRSMFVTSASSQTMAAARRRRRVGR